MKIRNQLAFTLAEVLITLGVIGVVAALTIPTLSAKIQDNILKNQFKTLDFGLYMVYNNHVNMVFDNQ